MLGGLAVAGALGLWQALSVFHALPREFFPSAWSVALELKTLVGEGSFWSAVGATMESWALGLAIAVVLGVPIGILLGSNGRMYSFTRVVIEGLKPVPPVVLIPIALLVLGTGLTMQLVLIVQGALWPILLHSIYGVRSVDPIALETGASFRLTPTQRFVYIRVPGSLPLIATGVRVAATIALVVSVVAELVGGAAGLGNEILKAESSNAVVLMYALIVTTGLLGMAVSSTFRSVERRVLFWHPAHRGAP